MRSINAAERCAVNHVHRRCASELGGGVYMRVGLALLLTGGAVGPAITVLLMNNEKETAFAMRSDSVERALAKLFAGV